MLEILQHPDHDWLIEVSAEEGARETRYVAKKSKEGWVVAVADAA